MHLKIFILLPLLFATLNVSAQGFSQVGGSDPYSNLSQPSVTGDPYAVQPVPGRQDAIPQQATGGISNAASGATLNPGLDTTTQQQSADIIASAERVRDQAVYQRTENYVLSGAYTAMCAAAGWPNGMPLCAKGAQHLADGVRIELSGVIPQAEQNIAKLKAALGDEDAGVVSADSALGTAGPSNQASGSYNQFNKQMDIKAAELKKELAKMGFKVDEKGNAIGPDGKSVGGASLPPSLEAAAKAEVQKAKELARSLMKSGKSHADSFGGGGGSRAPSSLGAPSMNAVNFNGMGGKAVGAGGALSVAGMQKKLGDEKVGVSSDNIFQMVERRYGTKRSGNGFIE